MTTTDVPVVLQDKLALTATLVCEGKCNEGLVHPGDVGPFLLRRANGTNVRHTLHTEVMSVVNVQANVRRRQWRCLRCGHERTFGVDVLNAAMEPRSEES